MRPLTRSASTRHRAPAPQRRHPTRTIGLATGLAATAVATIFGVGALAASPAHAPADPSLSALATSPTDDAAPAERRVHRSTTFSGPAPVTDTAPPPATVVPGTTLKKAPPPPPEPVTRIDDFNLMTFNVLGAGHTRPGGGPHTKERFASFGARMANAISIVRGHGADVVGFQEFEPPQLAQFRHTMGSSWATFSGSRMTSNSIAWRTDRFTFVEGWTVTVPYFHGHPTPMPVVVLRSTTTGADMIFFNTHNPADARGPAAAFRARALAIERAAVAQYTAERQVPVFFTGDMNDRGFYCPFTSNGVMQSAAGGINSTDGLCAPPAFHGIDWIFGNSYAAFSGFRVDRGPLVQRTTDHPVVSTHVTVTTTFTPDA